MTFVPPRSVTDTIADPQWQPLRVTATMAEPIVTDTDPMHLDGPLSWCACLEHQAQGGQLPPMTPDACVDFHLGLATWTRPCPVSGVGGRWLAADGASTWGWACSAAYAPPTTATIAHTRRPVPVREIARYTTAKNVHTGAGPNKARNVPHAAIIAPTVTWWCIGNPDVVQHLLDSHLRGLGRLTRHGHGRVLTVDITVDEQARDRWQWRQWPQPGSPTTGACRAPYHHQTRRMPVTILGAPPWA